MASITIDLMGDSDDTITTPKEPTKEELERAEHYEQLRKQFIEELLRKAPQPQVVPVEDTKR